MNKQKYFYFLTEIKIIDNNKLLLFAGPPILAKSFSDAQEYCNLCSPNCEIIGHLVEPFNEYTIITVN